MNVDYLKVTERRFKCAIDVGKYAVGVEQVGNTTVTTFYLITDFDNRYCVIGKKNEKVHLNPFGREVHYYLNRMYLNEEEK